MAESDLKVLHLFPEFKRGGAQVNVLRFIRSSQNDFTHYVAAGPFNDDLLQEYRKYVDQIYMIDMTSLKLSSLLKLTRLIRTLRPDIVHVNGKGAALYGFLSSFLTGKPYRIYHTMRGFHIKFSGLKLKLYLQFEKMAARRMDGNILVSPSERNLLMESIPGLDRSKLFLIPNGISVSEVPLPREIRETTDRHGCNIVTLSRLSHQKDLISMLEAFETVAASHPETALHIMGGETPQDREYAEQVREKLAACTYRDRIYLWGSVKDAGNLIRHFHIYWTTAKFEGLPTAVVEAGLSRVLTVGTDCVGNVDVIIPGKTGILTETGNPGSAAEGLLRALKIRETGEAEALKKAAESLCLNFSLENNAEKLRELYNSKG